MAKKQKVIPLIGDTYLAVIKNSVGSKMFRNFYAKVDGKKLDITRNGGLSCAFYASSILALAKQIKGIHTTVSSTVQDLQKSGWKIIKKPKVGSVLVWEKSNLGDNSAHKHIGFYIRNGKAVSNSYKRGCPLEHNWILANRKIEMILWNSKLKFT